MASVKPGIFSPPEPIEREGEIIEVGVEAEDAGVEIGEVVEAEESSGSLEHAEAVVAGGWGMNCFGGLNLAGELAELLGGGLGGTRPAVDAGWIPHEKMIGQSGITVSPNLLVTLGASGAAQFVTTALGSGFILAVDRNTAAPIFEAADLGIVGDLQEILPLLINKIREIKGV